jgi:hypothetical protein
MTVSGNEFALLDFSHDHPAVMAVHEGAHIAKLGRPRETIPGHRGWMKPSATV